MWIVVDKLTLKMLEDKMESFIKSLEPLKWDPNANPDRMIQIFKKNENFETIIVAIDEESWDIVWSLRALSLSNYIRWWWIMWRVEEVVVWLWQQGKWIWTLLLKSALVHFEYEWCYKVSLACSEQNKWFYERFWFDWIETEMKLYIK